MTVCMVAFTVPAAIALGVAVQVFRWLTAS